MKRKRVIKPKDIQGQKEHTKGFSGDAVSRRPIIVIGSPALSEPVEKGLPKKHLDQALDNAIVRGDFERVKKLVKQDGAKPMDRHLETAMDMKEEKIAAYLKAEIEKRRSDAGVSMPSEDGWD
jgi:hypothetical protein